MSTLKRATDGQRITAVMRRSRRTRCKRFVESALVVKSALALVLLVAASCTGSDNIDRVRADWMLEAPPSDDVLPVLVQIGSSSCNSFDEVTVTETASQVTIEAYVNHKTYLHECTADLRMHHEPVQLAAPLGQRSLVGCFVQPTKRTRWESTLIAADVSSRSFSRPSPVGDARRIPIGG